ncbi:MAG: hypothetical protein JXQ91_07975 [Vannielia sp.]|uniref:hypothetical protein n=1 Tax=Vannielia sp. TaxID=2813045 RepID=UPI003B8D7FA7
MSLRRCALPLAFALAAFPAQAELAPEDAVELAQIMAGLPVTRHDGVIAAMHGRDALFARLKDGAEAGDSESYAAFLLYGQVALLSFDGATEESFTAAVKPLYDAGPERMLAALEAAPWMIAGTCYLIGGWFGFEDRNADGREGFLDSERARIGAALPGPMAERCTAQIAAPTRPY